MRLPVGKTGTKEEFDKEWYSAQGFGVKTDYGFHEAEDINLKSGGDTDLGQPLYAVANGRIVYYHENSHPTSGFGKHMVLEVNTPFGTRWYHYVHCDQITAQKKDVQEGEIIGRLGKTGTTYAHLHFACFKVDPATLRSGIDTIAKTQEELNKWWENPFLTLLQQPQTIVKEIPSWLTTLLTERGLTIDNEPQIREIFDKAGRYDTQVRELQEQVKSANEALGVKATEAAMMIDKIQKLENKVEELNTLYNTAKSERDEFEWQARNLNLQVENLQDQLSKQEAEIQTLWEEIKTLKAKNVEATDKLSTYQLIGILLDRIFKRG